MNKAVIFDLDGTLLYTLEDLWQATNATLRAFGLPERTLEEVRQFVGNGAVNQMRMAVGGEPENFGEIMAYYRDYYPRHCNETTRPYPGIVAAAEVLKSAGFSLAIVSNKPDGATKTLWKTYFPTFDYALGESPETPRKPAPDMVRKAMAALGADRAVYVGDSEVDVATARAAGLPCISALWGYRDRQTLVESGAACLCRTPEELPALVEEMGHGQ
ncbi:MAG TPA: HAD-IA family hydrolase [Candidatus Faecousia faecigallinarum]|nr:HAD-IA family hydrolase [Candidatus Faecousia faecigallinarum]